MRRLDPHAFEVGAVLALGFPHLRFTRDLAMFLLGGAAFTYETLTGGDRPNILYGALALMGVAAYLRGVAATKDKQ